jgi:hypothetical protein
MKYLRNLNLLYISTYLLLLLSIWSFIWSFFDGGFLNLRYFTNQSVMIVMITLLFFSINQRNHRYFKYLSAIALINIFITATGFHFILRPSNIGFQGHLSHTIIPILYIAFYMIFIKNILKLKEFLIVLIYPLLYLFFAIVLGPITNFYPYGFLDVGTLGLIPVIRFTLLIMVPSYTIIALGLIYIKLKIESKQTITSN